MLKAYDLIIANIDLLPSSSNHEVMFPEYSRNIPEMFVSKISQGYPRNIIKLFKYFLKSKSSKKFFVGYPVKNLILAVFSRNVFQNFVVTVLHLE